MIYITGDCHGRFDRFSMQEFPDQEEMDEQDLVIVCGDFGYWDHMPEQRYFLDQLEKLDFTIAFVDGNHENFDLLNSLEVKEWKGGYVQYVRKNVIHLMRGNLYSIQGEKFFTFGGARSHDISDGILEPDDPQLREKAADLEHRDAMYRINHLSWWKEEMPSETEFQRGLDCLQKNGWNCDYVITHCAPASIQAVVPPGWYAPDPLNQYLEEIKNRIDYKRWFCGHYHIDEWTDEKHRILYHDLIRIL
jgi:hypothetical protein